MRNLLSLFVSFCLGMCLVVSASAAPGAVDRSFGNNGVVTLDFAGKLIRPIGTVLQPDGKMLIAGTVFSLFNREESQWYVTRLDADGRPDTTFGTMGSVWLPLRSQYTRVNTFHLLQSGDILLTGWDCRPGSHCGTWSVAGFANRMRVLKLTSQGQVDTSFADQGSYVEDIPDAYGCCPGITALEQHHNQRHIVILTRAGLGLEGAVRSTFLTRDGVRASGFNGADISKVFSKDGVYSYNSAFLNPADDSMLLGSLRFGEILRFDRNGNLDTAFGNGGKTATVFSQDARTSVLGIDSAGSITLGTDVKTFGHLGCISGCSTAYHVMRYSAPGMQDTQFSLRIPPYEGGIRMPDGSFVRSDQVCSEAGCVLSVTRRLPDGTPDPQYVEDRRQRTETLFVEGYSQTWGTYPQTNGRVTVVGYFDSRLAIARFLVNPFVDPDQQSGIWWNPQESGWGLAMQRNANGTTFAVWFTYDKTGRATWYHMPAGQPTSGANTVEGDVYRATGPSYAAAVFDPAQVRLGNPVGRFRIEWQSADRALFTFDVEGVQATKVIQPHLKVPKGFAADSGFYWNPTESGWGFARYTGSLPGQDIDTLNAFGVWFTYDEQGATWFVSPGGARAAGVNEDQVIGQVYRPSGPPLAATFDPARVVNGAPVGSFRYRTRGSGAGTLQYQIQNSSGTKQLTRFLF